MAIGNDITRGPGIFVSLILFSVIFPMSGAFGQDVEPEGLQDVLGIDWRESDVRPSRKWYPRDFHAEAELYKLVDGYNILKEGEAARVVLSPFIGVMDGPFDTPTVTYWTGEDLIAAAPRLRDIVANALAEALAGQADPGRINTEVELIEIERPGLWACGVGKGCYPEGFVIATRPMEAEEAELLCMRLHDMDKICAVIRTSR